MAKTHYAAVKDGIVVGTRSSDSRHIEGVGRFGVYTHAIMRRERTTLLASGDVTEVNVVISWHGGLANAASGIKAAHVGRTWTVDYDYRPRETHHTTTYLAAEIVPVVVTPRPAKIGQVIAPAMDMGMSR